MKFWTTLIVIFVLGLAAGVVGCGDDDDDDDDDDDTAETN
jgi:hypothetical protein